MLALQVRVTPLPICAWSHYAKEFMVRNNGNIFFFQTHFLALNASIRSFHGFFFEIVPTNKMHGILLCRFRVFMKNTTFQWNALHKKGVSIFVFLNCVVGEKSEGRPFRRNNTVFKCSITHSPPSHHGSQLLYGKDRL